jgi:hypothetical protein
MNQEEFDNYLLQSDLQKQNNEYEGSLNAPQLMEQLQNTQAILVESTNPKKVIEEIILKLRGLNKLTDGRLVKEGREMMNKEGIDQVKFILNSHINQNVILSHLEEEQIKRIMLRISDSLIDDFTLNWRAYGIKNKTDLDVILDAILLGIYYSLNRALGQNEKNWLGKITLENLSSGSRLPMPKKEGILSKFKL